jgi:3-dehydroquinate dehydratase / shikimate dehydrogenase
MTSDHKTRICVPINETTLSALETAAHQAVEAADLIELRIDGLDRAELENATLKIKHLVATIPRPVILTFRSKEQGGRVAITEHERRMFWGAQFSNSSAAFLDIESDLVEELTTREIFDQPDWSCVICSHHDFEGVPENLEEIYERMTASPARILKVAVYANDIVDCLSMFQLLQRAKQDQREVIAIAMGNAGIATRVLGPARGAFLTYGPTAADRGTAPGQVTASALRSVYRIDEIDDETLITGLVGLPVMHSVSPHMHNAAFQSTGTNGVYLPFEVHDLAAFFTRMVDPRTRELDWNLRGLSVTAPHKARVLEYLDWIDPRAQEIGAVNTVVVEDNQLLGYNTDAEGLVEPLLRKVGSLSELRIAVLGSGGAASAAVWALLRHQADVTLFVRDPAKGQSLSDRFNISCQSLTSASFLDVDIVINATPLGSLGEHIGETPVVADQLRGTRLVYDLVYNPIETKLLNEARLAGCEVLGGLDMLVAQANLQFNLWTNETASSKIMHAAAMRALTSSLSAR